MVFVTDVRPPDDTNTCLKHWLGQAGSLRIVQDNDVPCPYLRADGGCVLGQHSFIVRALCLAQRATVARFSVQIVVDALGYAKEFTVALDDEPA